MDFPEKYKKLWSYWDMRVLILGSLFIQIILFFLGRLRKTTASRWIRMAVWSSYLLADWVADFVLGKLSNAMDDSSSSSVAILAFWAPFLILHLGGPDTITAYSIEDNELWARHLLGLGYELIIVSYVLIRSLPGNLLLAPTLLIFLVAIIKYAERTYSLYKASAAGLRSSINSYAKKLSTNIKSIHLTMFRGSYEDLNGLNGAFRLYYARKPFLIDSIPFFELHKISGKMFAGMTAKEVLWVTSKELSFAYDDIFTKAAFNHSRAGYILRVLCSIFIMLAFFLFHFVPKHDYEKMDIIIAYVLLSASACLDATAGIMLVFSDWMIISLLDLNKFTIWGELLARRIAGIKTWLVGRYGRKYWSGEMPQLSLISNCLKNYAANEAPERWRLISFTKKLCFVHEEKLYPIWDGYNKKAFTLHALNPVKADSIFLEIIASYAQRIFHVPSKNLKDPAGLSALQQITDAPTWAFPTFTKLFVGLTFDLKVLVWHIATELCYHWNQESLHPLHPRRLTEQETDEDRVNRKSQSDIMKACKFLSNYMMHMILMRPEMLSTMRGSDPMKIWLVCKFIMEFIQSWDGYQSAATAAEVQEALCRKMLETPIMQQTLMPLLRVPRVLALLLLLVNDEEDRWRVVMTAWAELLIQGAMKSSASMHLKQLSRGGELLTFFWLLVKHANVEDDLFAEASAEEDVDEVPIQLLADIKHHLSNQL